MDGNKLVTWEDCVAAHGKRAKGQICGIDIVGQVHVGAATACLLHNNLHAAGVIPWALFFASARVGVFETYSVELLPDAAPAPAPAKEEGAEAKPTGLNREHLSDEILAQMPKGARLLESEEERKAFAASDKAHTDLYLYCGREWSVGLWRGNAKNTTYCTTRPRGWWKKQEKPAEPAPIRVAYSRDEAIRKARQFMVSTYGAFGGDSDQQDRWHERFGLLVSFLMECFPPNTTAHLRAAKENT